MKLILVVIALVAGCQSGFKRTAHTDPATCQSKCASSNMTMTGMVYMGEYSSACICEVPRPAGAPAPAPTATPGAAAGVSAASAS
ncbi:MAG: hypothetical protein ABI867_41350 [Kofleriaceae bacterium]